MPGGRLWSADRLCVKVAALRFREIVEPVLAQQLIQAPVEGMTCSRRQLGRRDPHRHLPIALRLPMAMQASLRREVAALDPLLPLANVKSLATLVDASIAGRRFTMVLFLAFPVVSPTLSVIGVYSVLAYLVSQRTKEIGLRLAIGALPSGVIWLVVREGMLLTTVGLTAGLAGALAADRWIHSPLFGVTPADPATFAGVACALTVAAVLATYIPARRAASVDPTDALRTD